MMQIGVFINGKAFRATLGNSSLVSWCSEDLANQLGLKIVPLEKPKKGITTMNEKIFFEGTVTTMLELSPVVRLNDFTFLVAKVARESISLGGTDFSEKFSTFKADWNGLRLNGVMHWWLGKDEREKGVVFTSPSIIDLINSEVANDEMWTGNRQRINKGKRYLIGKKKKLSCLI